MNNTEELKKIIKDLIAHHSEEEWFEFKENWYEPNALGEYISSMSNVAAMLGEKTAYLVWGVTNDTHEVVGTTFNYHQDICKDILGCDISSEAGMLYARENGLFNDICPRMVESAVDILEDMEI